MGYFNVTVKPYIDPDEQDDGDITTGQILADWTAFEIPKGAACLKSLTCLYRGTDGADVAVTDFEVIIAKSNPDGTAPTSLGAVAAAVGAPAAGSPPWFNLIQGRVYIDADKSTDSNDLTYLNVVTPSVLHGGDSASDYNHAGQPNLILQGEPNSGSNVGFDKLYCALIAKATHNWASTLDINGTMVTTSPILTVDTIDARLAVAPGDVLYDEDNLLLGTVKSVDSATQITMESNLANASSNNKKIYNGSPITLVLGFEQ